MHCRQADRQTSRKQCTIDTSYGMATGLNLLCYNKNLLCYNKNLYSKDQMNLDVKMIV